MLLFFMPFGIVISLIILFNSSGGIFYIQKRIGRYRKEFNLLKFRTMYKDADKSGKLTIGISDNRITYIGYFLRKYKLDEFPQFINVLKGEMSIVGPRPEVKEYVDMYNESQLDVLKVKPGITDLASLEYFNENYILGKSSNPEKTYVDEVMPAKIELNKKYIANSSIFQDINIVWRTFKKIIS